MAVVAAFSGLARSPHRILATPKIYWISLARPALSVTAGAPAAFLQAGK